MNIIIRTENLGKNFGKVKALDDLNLEINEGELYGLLGPNGSGKTTLLRILVGVLLPTYGKIQIMGSDKPFLRSSEIGYMNQSESLYIDLTVQENLSFFGSLYGVKKSQCRKKVDELLDLFKLSERADDLVGNLSGGTKKRVSLACALVHNPKLLILDEPTVGIDPALRISFWDHLYQLNKKGVTILISSHQMDEAEKCLRLGFLREGKLLAEGSPAEIKSVTGKETLEESFLHFIKSNTHQTNVI